MKNQKILTLMLALSLTFLTSLELKAETGTCVMVPQPPHEVTSCNGGEYLIFASEVRPDGHSCPQKSYTKYMARLSGEILKDVVKADRDNENHTIERMIQEQGGKLSLNQAAYDATITISLCKNGNCSSGPNLLIEGARESKNSKPYALIFSYANLGGVFERGRVALDCE